MTSELSLVLRENLVERADSLIKNPAIRRGALESAVAILTTPVNEATVSPLKYYASTVFINCVENAVTEKKLIERDTNSEISPNDQLMYHLLLYIISKCILNNTPFNNELILAQLSSPSVIKWAVSQSWFQSLKEECKEILMQFSKEYLKQLAWKWGEKKAKEYIEKEYIEPAKQIIYGDKVELAERLVESVKSVAEKRKDLALELISNAASAASTSYCALSENAVSDLATTRNVSKVLDFIEDTQDKWGKLTAKPEIKIFKPEKSSLSVPTKVMTAWGMSSYTNPAMGPLFFISPDADLSEVAIRLGGVIAGALTENYLLSILAAEVAVKKTPGFIKKNPLLLKASEPVQKTIKAGVDAINFVKNDFIRQSKDEGATASQLELVSKLTAQSVGGIMYVALFANGHPFANAMNSSYFIDYIGKMGENLGVMSHKSTQGKAGIEALPYKVMVGLAMTAFAYQFGEAAYPMACLQGMLLTAPIVTDAVVSTDFYQNNISEPIKQLVVGDYEKLTQIQNGWRASRILKQLPYASAVFETAEKSLVVAGGSAAAAAAYKVASHPKMGEAVVKACEVGQKSLALYTKYNLVSTATYYLGPEVGALVNVISKPNDKTTVGVAIIGLAVSTFSQSPVLTVAAMETANAALRTEKAQTLFSKVGSALYNAAVVVNGYVDSAAQAVREDPTRIGKSFFSLLNPLSVRA